MEKIFRKDDKEYLVGVSLRDGYFYNDIIFEVDLHIRLKGKRKWNPFINVNDYKYRRLGIKQRDDYRKMSITSEIPFEWIEEVKQMEIERVSSSEYRY